MSKADAIALKFQAARGKLMEATFPDTYVIRRVTQVDDGYGGYTDVVTDVEPGGRCMLQIAGMSGGPNENGTIVLTRSPMTAKLPYTSTITDDDTIVINNRAMNVLDVRRGGEWGLFTEVDVEEVS